MFSFANIKLSTVLDVHILKVYLFERSLYLEGDFNYHNINFRSKYLNLNSILDVIHMKYI